jgi:multiple sugar transport system substrate-binding protein
METRRSLLLNTAALVAGSVASVALPASRSVAQDTAPVKLVVANSQWLDALRGKNLWAAVQKYQGVAPNVTLEQEAIPSNEFADKILTEVAAGLGPDILIMQEGIFYTLAKAGYLIDVGKAGEGVALNNTNENGVVNGVRMGLTWQRAAYALIYNKPLAAKAGAAVPKTVDELIKSALAVKAQGAIGFASRYSMAEFAFWFVDFQNWAYGYGVNWVDSTGKLTINTPEAVAAFKAFKAIYDSNTIPIGDTFIVQRTRFKQMGVGFSIDNSGGTLNIASGGALKGTDLGSVSLPFEHPGVHQQIFLGVSRNSKHPEESIAVLKWLMTPDGQTALRAASGPDGLATDVPVTEEFKATNPWAETFAQLAVNSRSPLIPGFEVETPQIMRVVMDAMERVLIANQDPEAALADAQKLIDAKKF